MLWCMAIKRKFVWGAVAQITFTLLWFCRIKYILSSPSYKYEIKVISNYGGQNFVTILKTLMEMMNFLHCNHRLVLLLNLYWHASTFNPLRAMKKETNKENCRKWSTLDDDAGGDPNDGGDAGDEWWWCRAAEVVWRSPILSWPRIMFSKRVCSDFFDRRDKCRKIECLEEKYCSCLPFK